jgi:membrane protease YdiL (CAAX protease family)
LGGGRRHRYLDRIQSLVPALISGLLAGLLEEFGWSGFAFPALQARFGFLRAGAAVGVIIAVWHLPYFLLPGTTQNTSSFVMFLLTLIVARVVYGWVYNGSGGSVLLAILLHASGNTWSEVLSQAPAATTASAAGWTEIGVFTGAALVAVWITRRRASRLQEHRP